MGVLLSDLPEPLRRANAPVEVIDDSGRVAGWFQPIPANVPSGVSPLGYNPPVLETEIQKRRERYRSGKTLVEIMQRLEAESP